MLTQKTVSVQEQGKIAKSVISIVANATPKQRYLALTTLSDELVAQKAKILTANSTDLELAKAKGQDHHVTERMVLTHERIRDIASSVRTVASLPDPVGQVLQERKLPNGMMLKKVRVPLGVLGVIFESRPNVTVDIASLAIKSGNAVIMRGSSVCINTNTVLTRIIRGALKQAGIHPDAVQLVEDTNRSAVNDMLKMNRHIDLLIPRGSAELVNMVAQNATMPAITGGIGVCHTYVDSHANTQMALDIVHNAKVQRYTVCNALDTLLVHSNIATTFIPLIAHKLLSSGVEIRGDSKVVNILHHNGITANVVSATEVDFGKEFLALVVSVKIVESIDDAIHHISHYGSGHSEAIVTDSQEHADKFLNQVDASAVFHNASTRYNDGGEFGLGAEVAISTSKFHARGPMGINEICSYKWLVLGSGNTR